jgi:hypothetical protein
VPFEHRTRDEDMEEDDDESLGSGSRPRTMRVRVVQVIGLFLLGCAMGGAWRILERPAARSEALTWITTDHTHTLSDWASRARSAIGGLFEDW